MTALDDIAAERARQINAEGWTPEHDDAHPAGMLAIAGAAYARSAHNHLSGLTISTHNIGQWWPWDVKWWKPTGFRRDLVKAAALIVAEIERFDRRDSSRSAAVTDIDPAPLLRCLADIAAMADAPDVYTRSCIAETARAMLRRSLSASRPSRGDEA